MNQIATKPPFTPEDLMAIPNGDDYELVNGELVERHMGGRSVWVGGNLGYRLHGWNDEHGAGWVLPADASYQCFPGVPNLVRKPDVSFISRGRLPDDELPDGNFRVAPDLAAEVVSPNDLYYDVEQKVAEYLAAGVRLVWVVNPVSERVRVHRADGTVADLRGDAELNGEGVLPGFRCRVSDLFKAPAPRRPEP